RPHDVRPHQILVFVESLVNLVDRLRAWYIRRSDRVKPADPIRCAPEHQAGHYARVSFAEICLQRTGRDRCTDSDRHKQQPRETIHDYGVFSGAGVDGAGASFGGSVGNADGCDAAGVAGFSVCAAGTVSGWEAGAELTGAVWIALCISDVL